MSDAEYKELQAKEAALWSESEAARALWQSISAEWCPVHQAMKAEEYRREIIAQMVAAGEIPAPKPIESGFEDVPTATRNASRHGCSECSEQNVANGKAVTP